MRNENKIFNVLNEFRPDLVIHCAGLKSVEEGEKNPILYYDNNVKGTINLLKSMDKVGCEKILFSSSATVYGIPKYLPYDENHATEPMNVYGRTKLIVEDLIKSWTAKGNKSAIALRYYPAGANRSSIIGEQGTNDPKNLFPILTKYCKMMTQVSKFLETIMKHSMAPVFEIIYI